MNTVNGIFAILGIIIGWLITYAKFKTERKDKFRMAAIEKRLEAHQKAYAVCMRFWDVIDTDSEEEVRSVIKDGKDLMSNYSLYLESGTRKMMVKTIGFFIAYCPREKFVSKFEFSKRKNAYDIFIKESKSLDELSNLIQQEVALEPISIRDNKGL